MILVDTSDHKHYATEAISLTWYRNDEPTSRKTDFFIIDSGPYDMLLGEEFLKENLEKLFGEEFAKDNFELEDENPTLLPGRMRPMTKGELIIPALYIVWYQLLRILKRKRSSSTSIKRTRGRKTMKMLQRNVRQRLTNLQKIGFNGHL
jgi:hypothetical protein